MRRSITAFSMLPLFLLLLTGCTAIGDKSASLSIVYGATATLSLIMLIVYCCVDKKKDPRFLLLFTSVLVVNIGYFALAISKNLDEALLANRLAYLGSVFLPLSMWLIILNVTRVPHPKWLPGLLVALGAVVFLIAASPGYLDIYYKEVHFQIIHGIAVLKKVYGPLHFIYLVYLLGYFAAMVITIVRATLRNTVDSIAYAVILAIAVFVNIGVWILEQMVAIDFEILSVSYIITESFLLGLHLFIIETEKQKALLLQQANNAPPTEVPAAPENSAAAPPVCEVRADQAQINLFISGISLLTPKERQLFDCYTAGMSTATIMEQLSIKENTLKFHNKNLYGKLGVSSRKQLLELYRIISLRQEL